MPNGHGDVERAPAGSASDVGANPTAQVASVQPWYLLGSWGYEPHQLAGCVCLIPMAKLDGTVMARDLDRSLTAKMDFQWFGLPDSRGETQSVKCQMTTRSEGNISFNWDGFSQKFPLTSGTPNQAFYASLLMRNVNNLFTQGWCQPHGAVLYGMLSCVADKSMGATLHVADGWHQHLLFDVRTVHASEHGARFVCTTSSDVVLQCDDQRLPTVYLRLFYLDVYKHDDATYAVRYLPMVDLVAVRGEEHAKRLLLKAPFFQVCELSESMRALIDRTQDDLEGVQSADDICVIAISLENEEPDCLQVPGYGRNPLQSMWSVPPAEVSRINASQSGHQEDLSQVKRSIVGYRFNVNSDFTLSSKVAGLIYAPAFVFTPKGDFHETVEHDVASWPIRLRQRYIMVAKLLCHTWEHALALRHFYHHGNQATCFKDDGWPVGVHDPYPYVFSDDFEALKNMPVLLPNDFGLAAQARWQHYVYLADFCNQADKGSIQSALSNQKEVKPVQELFPLLPPNALASWEYWQLFLMQLQPERIQMVLESTWAQKDVEQISKDQWVKIGLSLGVAQRKNLSMVDLPAITQAAQADPLGWQQTDCEFEHDASGITGQIKPNADWCYFPADVPVEVQEVVPSHDDSQDQPEPVQARGPWVRWVFWGVVMAAVGLVMFYALPFVIPAIAGLSALATKGVFAASVAMAVPALRLWVGTWLMSLPVKKQGASDAYNAIRIKRKWLYWGKLMLYALMSAPLVVVCFAAWAPGAIGFAAMWGAVAKVGGIWAQLGVASLMVAGANMLVGTLNAWWVCGVADRYPASRWGIFWRALGKLLSVFALTGGILWLGGVASAIATTLVSSWTSWFAVDGVMTGMVGSVAVLGAAGLASVRPRAADSGGRSFEFEKHPGDGREVVTPARHKEERRTGVRLPPTKNKYDPCKKGGRTRSSSPDTVKDGLDFSKGPSC